MVSCHCVVQLVKSVPQRDRPKAQALAETIQQISNTCASVGSGIVTGNFGWSGVAVTSIVPMMMCIVATVLTCYAEHRQRSTQDNGSGKNGRSSVGRTSHSQYVSLKTAEEDVDETLVIRLERLLSNDVGNRQRREVAPQNQKHYSEINMDATSAITFDVIGN